MKDKETDPTPAKTLLQIRDEILGGFSADHIDVYSAIVRWLQENGIAEQALKPGVTAPDFLLPDAGGHLVSSQGLRRRGNLVVSFFRGSWCPFCTAELCALQAALPHFRALNASLVAITPDTGDFPHELKRAQGLDLTILSDVDYGVGLSYGVIFAVPAAIKVRFLERGLDLSARHGTSTWMLPLPATFVIDGAGVIRAAHVEPDSTIRAEPAVIMQELQRLNASQAQWYSIQPLLPRWSRSSCAR